MTNEQIRNLAPGQDIRVYAPGRDGEPEPTVYQIEAVLSRHTTDSSSPAGAGHEYAQVGARDRDGNVRQITIDSDEYVEALGLQAVVEREVCGTKVPTRVAGAELVEAGVFAPKGCLLIGEIAIRDSSHSDGVYRVTKDDEFELGSFLEEHGGFRFYDTETDDIVCCWPGMAPVTAYELLVTSPRKTPTPYHELPYVDPDVGPRWRRLLERGINRVTKGAESDRIEYPTESVEDHSADAEFNEDRLVIDTTPITHESILKAQERLDKATSQYYARALARFVGTDE